jgi:hypothetical protein
MRLQTNTKGNSPDRQNLLGLSEKANGLLTAVNEFTKYLELSLLSQEFVSSLVHEHGGT